LLLPFRGLNHVRVDNFKSKPPCPQWPNDRTYQRLSKTDVNDPNRTPLVLERINVTVQF
jgi:hypothetical protein